MDISSKFSFTEPEIAKKYNLNTFPPYKVTNTVKTTMFFSDYQNTKYEVR